MGAAIFIGDEVAAAGFRLAGIETMTPTIEAIVPALEEAKRKAALVIIAASIARHIPRSDLETTLRAAQPIVVIVSDLLSPARSPDLGGRLRVLLGIEP
jgi:vacuolar-type H+-ATPase subunit F/Vma7